MYPYGYTTITSDDSDDVFSRVVVTVSFLNPLWHMLRLPTSLVMKIYFNFFYIGSLMLTYLGDYEIYSGDSLKEGLYAFFVAKSYFFVIVSKTDFKFLFTIYLSNN